jgi:hypothetical protein
VLDNTEKRKSPSIMSASGAIQQVINHHITRFVVGDFPFIATFSISN